MIDDRVNPVSLELVNRVIAENPYPTYTFTAQNRTVEVGRAERHARTIALLVLRENAKAITEAMYPEASRRDS